MLHRIIKTSGKTSGSFNMTPIIDIVFLLIIFFLVVFQFIDVEAIEVNIPDKCDYADNSQNPDDHIVNISVRKTDGSMSEYAVGTEILEGEDYNEISSRMTELIDSKLRSVNADKRVVNLRIDKDICFDEAQYVLSAVYQSCASDIKIAAMKQERLNQE